MNMSSWFNFYSFDVMGDLGFGHSFGMLKSKQTHWAIKVMSNGFALTAFAFPAWFIRFLRAIPGATKAAEKMRKFFVEQMENRKRLHGKFQDPDIMHFLIEDYNKASLEKQNKLDHILPL